MNATPLEVADIFRAYGEAYRIKRGLTPNHERVMRAIIQCRTPELGGHLYVCDGCGVVNERYNSCRNRHCPKCGFLDKARWLEMRREELLPTNYFHVVFTLPDHLNPVVMRNEAELYNLLFRSAAGALTEIAADPKHLGATIGFLAVLHTWGQKLQLHPHIHAIVPGGGLSPSRDSWISCRKNFFLPVKVLGALLRGKFLADLRENAENEKLLFPQELDPKRAPARYRSWLDELYAASWVVYSKPPFGGSEQALGYLARYTHRVALSNDRLLRLEDDRVHFQYKDYTDASQSKTTSLEAPEFIRRYLLHVLPPGFHRIRYYGLFANRWRAANLERCRALLGAQPPEAERPADAGDQDSESWEQQLRRLTGIDPTVCPLCKTGRLVYLETLRRQPEATSRAPP